MSFRYVWLYIGMNVALIEAIEFMKLVKKELFIFANNYKKVAK